VDKCGSFATLLTPDSIAPSVFPLVRCGQRVPHATVPLGSIMKHLLHLAAVAPIGVCCALALADLPPIPAGASSAGAQVVNRYGSEYVIIPGGNPAFYGADHLANPYYGGTTFDGGGSVPYGFGIARTETTAAEWCEFVNGYAPYWQGTATDPRLRSFMLGRDSNGRYTYDASVARVPVSGISWLVAASYCNWLSNGKRLDQAAFETGAYDLRGINTAAMVPRSMPVSQNLQAAFRLPTLDEWYKAGYYDPNRRGPSAGGWWLYPNGVDRPPVPGLPGGLSETSSGVASQLPFGEFIDVASYSGQSPWGLFDVSGGVAEYLSTSGGIVPGRGELMYAAGTYTEGSFSTSDEQPAWSRQGVLIGDYYSVNGIRVVWTVPTGNAAVPFAFVLLMLRRSRK
jgi:formylglycine-generating enzyme required for sulfatase activity